MRCSSSPLHTGPATFSTIISWLADGFVSEIRWWWGKYLGDLSLSSEDAALTACPHNGAFLPEKSLRSSRQRDCW